MAFNHRNAQRKKPERIARQRRVSFGHRPKGWEPKRHTKRGPA